MDNGNKEKIEIDTQNNENGEKKKSNKKIIISFILAFILVALLIVSFATILNINKIETPPAPRPDPDFPIMIYKPIIYLYPEEEMQITVTLGKYEKVTCIYPEYKDGWKVIAKPNGDLIDLNTGRNLYALYWEGVSNVDISDNSGFVVKGIDTAKFLEEKLAILGLSDREAQEFIIYWLPQMQNSNYNYIRFATMDEINKLMPLHFSTEPDSLIRVFMTFKPLNKYIDVPEQKLTTPTRENFVVVEWGGSKL